MFLIHPTATTAFDGHDTLKGTTTKPQPLLQGHAELLGVVLGVAALVESVLDLFGNVVHHVVKARGFTIQNEFGVVARESNGGTGPSFGSTRIECFNVPDDLVFPRGLSQTGVELGNGCNGMGKVGRGGALGPAMVGRLVFIQQGVVVVLVVAVVETDVIFPLPGLKGWNVGGGAEGGRGGRGRGRGDGGDVIGGIFVVAVGFAFAFQFAWVCCVGVVSEFGMLQVVPQGVFQGCVFLG